MGSRAGRFAILEQFRADGMTYMFGNPGTVEQGFLDALLNFSDITYIETLQETIAVAIADGYARATQKPAIVQLHSGVGLGNGIGMMYQAMRGNTPLVVIAGESGVRYDAMDAQMAADLVAMAKPVTKYATRVVDPNSLLRVLRRAIKISTTPPRGPVFVSLPMDILDEPNTEDAVPSSSVETRVAPENAVITRAAEMLVSAERPMIIMGDGVAQSGAQAELTQVAELLGAGVWGANSSEVNMNQTHPLFNGLLGHMFGEHSREIVSQADAVLVCGTYIFPEVFPVLDSPFAAQAKVIHIDLDSYEIAKNFAVDLGLLADPKLALARLASQLDEMMTDQQREAARQRVEQHRRRQEDTAARERALDVSLENQMPLHSATFIQALAHRVPSDVIIVDEGLTVSPDITRYLTPTLPGSYFQTRGGSLGVGIPGAIGAKLAHPDRTVIGFSGDGGSMYTIQSLWTAAHHRVGAKFVIANNRSYKLLKLNLLQYWTERGLEPRDYPVPFDICDPEIQFADLARSMGVDAVRVETRDHFGPALDRMFADDEPFLIDLVISDELPDPIVHPKAGQ